MSDVSIPSPIFGRRRPGAATAASKQRVHVRLSAALTAQLYRRSVATRTTVSSITEQALVDFLTKCEGESCP